MRTYFLILKLLFYNISAVIQQSTEINLAVDQFEGVESAEGQEGEFFWLKLNILRLSVQLRNFYMH